MARKTKTKTRRPMRFPVSDFIAQHKAALDAGLTLQEFAKQAGIPYSKAVNRLHLLRQRGIVLPRLKHGLVGRPSNGRKGKAVTGGTPVIVPAGQTVRIDNGSDKPITITIGG